MNSPFRSKKVSVPPNAISRVIGRGGSNINTIRGVTGAHIEVEKQSKCQGERIITIKYVTSSASVLLLYSHNHNVVNNNFCIVYFFRGSSDATKQAHTLIAALIKDPEVDIWQMLPKSKLTVVTTSSWDKTITTVAVRLQ